jgi:hypothetical protein
MRQIVIGAMLGAAAVLLPLGAAAEPVFHLDTPNDGATVFGLVEVSGYIIDDGEDCGEPQNWPNCDWTGSGVSSVDLYVDGIFVASADLGKVRYDVIQAFPWYVGTPFENPGFSVSFDASAYTAGAHTLHLRVTFSDSTVQEMGQRTVIVEPARNQAPFGELELPGVDQPMNGVFPVTGWALDDRGLSTIEILIDGQIVGGANWGIHRPDIAHRFPSHPEAEYAGFIRMLNTTELTDGVHTISVRLTDTDGLSRVIGRRFVQTFNTNYNLPPFGGIDWPIPNRILYTEGCATPGEWSTPPFEEPEVVEVVLGWALDVGSSTDRGGVSYVQLLLDGSVLFDTKTGSQYWSWLDLDVNYYGHERLDIQRLFPDVPNAKDAGFAFYMDIADLFHNRGFSQGLHYLKVRAGDLENNVADIAQIPIIIDCDDDLDRPSWGDIYSPAQMERVAGMVEVAGWAIDLDGVEEVEVWVDGNFIDYVDEFPLPSPEVEVLFPWLPDFYTDFAGYRYTMDTQALNLPDGEHVLVIRTRDRWGGESIIGERTFVLDNLKNAAALPLTR